MTLDAIQEELRLLRQKVAPLLQEQPKSFGGLPKSSGAPPIAAQLGAARANLAAAAAQLGALFASQKGIGLTIKIPL
jgi:hypothetical protein